MVEIHEPNESSMINDTQDLDSRTQNLLLNLTTSKTTIKQKMQQIALTPNTCLTNTDCEGGEGGVGGGDWRENKVRVLAQLFEYGSIQDTNGSIQSEAMEPTPQKLNNKYSSTSSNNIEATTVIEIYNGDDGDDDDGDGDISSNVDGAESIKDVSLSSLDSSKTSLTSSVSESKDNLILPSLDSISIESSIVTAPEEITPSTTLEQVKLPSLKSFASVTNKVLGVNLSTKKVLKTDFPTEYRFKRKRKQKWRTIAKHFNIGDAKEETQKPPVVLKKKEQEEEDRAKITEAIRKTRENRQLACIMLGLMIEAELPPKFYEMIVRSESIRTMLRRLVQSSKSKEFILNLFENDVDDDGTSSGREIVDDISSENSAKNVDAHSKITDYDKNEHSVILLANDDVFR